MKWAVSGSYEASTSVDAGLQLSRGSTSDIS